MKISRLERKIRQYFYKPGKVGLSSSQAIQDMDKMDRMLEKSVKRLTGKGKKAGKEKRK